MKKYWGTIGHVGTKAFTAILTLLAVKYFIVVLGKPGYGASAYIGQISLFVMLLELGWSDACTRKLAAMRKVSTLEERRRIANGNYGVNVLLAVLSLAIMLGLGLVIPVEGANLNRTDIFLMLAMAGVNLVAYYIRNRYTVLMKVEERFDLAASNDFISSIVGVVASVALLAVWRHPAALVLGGSFLWISSGFLGWLWYRKSGLPQDRPTLDAEVIKEVIPVGLREAPSKVANIAGNSADRLIVGNTLGTGPMADLNVSGRVAEALEAILQPLIWNALPRLSHTYENEQQRFHDSSLRYTRLCLAVAIAAILVPSACSGAFLRIWLGKDAPSAGAEILLGMGIYRACVFLAFSYRTVFFAAGRPQWFTAFTVYNAILTTGLTLPFVHYFGLAGVGGMNAFIATTTMLFLPFLIRKALGKDALTGKDMAGLYASFFGGVAVCLPLYYITNHTWLASHNFLCMLLGAVWGVAVFFLWIRLRLAELPSSAEEAILSRAKLRLVGRMLGVANRS